MAEPPNDPQLPDLNQNLTLPLDKAIEVGQLLQRADRGRVGVSRIGHTAPRRVGLASWY